MPGGFASLDTSFPNLEGQTTEQKLRALTDYLYQLLEQLRYTLHNLGVENLNVSSVKELGDIITEPIRAEIDDPDTGLSARINANADAITMEVSRATGAESLIRQSADDIKAQVTDGQGNYTVLNLKSDGLHIGNASGTSTIDGGNITANSITLSRLGSDVTSSFGDDNPAYIKNTYIDFRQVSSPAVYAGDFYGAAYHDYDANGNSYLTFDIVPDGNRGGGIILSSDVANIVLFSVENVVQGSQGSWVLLSRINGAGDATCIETTYDQSTGKIGKYLVGRWTISDGLVLGPYSAHAGLYGSLAERNSISNPETGQIFFVI